MGQSQQYNEEEGVPPYIYEGWSQPISPTFYAKLNYELF